MKCIAPGLRNILIKKYGSLKAASEALGISDQRLRRLYAKGLTVYDYGLIDELIEKLDLSPNIFKLVE